MKIIDREVTNIVDLAIISEIQAWSYYNCTPKARRELINQVRAKLETITKDDK